jgi:hypothetical protein
MSKGSNNGKIHLREIALRSALEGAIEALKAVRDKTLSLDEIECPERQEERLEKAIAAGEAALQTAATSPDLVAKLIQLKNDYPELTQDALAARLGIKKSYCSQCMTIATYIDPDILRSWTEDARAGKRHVGKTEMYDIARKRYGVSMQRMLYELAVISAKAE